MPSIIPHTRTGVMTPQGLIEAEIAFPQLVGRTCTLKHYAKVNVPSFKVRGEIVSYCSPDSTFAVTKRLFDAARKSILIGIYDFTAPHVKELVLQAMGRGVKVRLMLDIDGDKEQELFDELASMGANCVPAPSCASQHGNKVFRSSHEKVVVIDDEWSLVQSGNYSNHSCPLNTIDGGGDGKFAPGNRDTGLAVQSKPLAKFFSGILSSDMDLELSGPQSLAAQPEAAPAFLIEKAPTKVPSTRYPSAKHKLSGPLTVQPVLSPDNYMDVVPGVLRGAKRSILVQQQYIRSTQEKITNLLDAIKQARSANPQLDVRILLGKVFSTKPKDVAKEKAMLAHLKATYGLVLGKHVRYVNTDRLVHCHNKMVLVDGSGVLVSSQNWSKPAVWENREAGLWFEHKGICSYFTKIFETDWKDAAKTEPQGSPEVVDPQALAAGGYVRVEPGDYAEV